MLEILQSYLKTSEQLLEKYVASGDENAIRSGKVMVEYFKKQIEELQI